MLKMNNILKYTLLSLLAATLLVGCRKDDGLWDMPTSRKVTLELNVSSGKATRAELTAEEKNINELRIYAFYNDKSIGFLKRQNTTLAEHFYMDLELPESGTHTIELYAVANESEMLWENSPVTLADQMTKAELQELKFTSLASEEALPMYCKRVKSINVDAISPVANTENGHEGHFILADTVIMKLQRSVAKLSVYAAKVQGASSNPQILGVEMLSEGTRSYNYLFPQSNSVLNAIDSRANNRILLRTPVTITNAIAADNTAARDEVSNYTQVFSGEYLYEVTYGSSAWNIPSGDVRAAVLHIEYSLGVGQTVRHGYVYLPPIVRNKHIKVCILINAEGQIIINYEVAKWDDANVDNLHFDYPTHTYLLEKIPATNEETNAKPQNSASMSESKPFVGYFQMYYPENDAWRPTLMGLNGSSCTIRVYDVESNTEITSFPIDASEKWYRIEVSPNAGHMQAGEEVQLAVTYTADGFDNIEYLLINGSQNQYYWPYAGATAQDANYVIITMEN